MIILYRILKMALKARLRNLVLSALTTLGIAIGVAAVIAVVEIGQGSKTAVANTIESMGANNLLVQPGQASSGGVSFGAGSSMTLTPGDADAIAQECKPAVVSVAPIVRARTQVVYPGHNWVPLYIYGTTPSFLDVRQWDLGEGRIWTDQEGNSGAEVCVLGQTIVHELFGDRSPLGETVRVNNHPLKVIGTLSLKGANMMGVDQDDILLAPWRTIKFKVSGASAQTGNASAGNGAQAFESNSAFPSQAPQLYAVLSPTELTDNPPTLLPTNVDQVLVRVATEGQIKPAMAQMTAVLHERHKIRAGQADDFNVRDMTEMSKALGSTSDLMSGLLLAVASITLIVGGVAILIIMLISVTERTREIGLRMAVGARARDILQQFLAEAILLCLFGGLVGVGFGLVGSYLVTLIKGWPTEHSLPAIGAAVGVTALVGIVFGFYPAWKASRLDPIVALRYE